MADILHAKGALLYMDGANMNALAGIARPGDFGVDVMHLNLHKTFSTPHGGGGPGSGPVAVKQHLKPFLPMPRLARVDDRWTWNYDRPQSVGRVRAFYGNFGVLLRALAYIMAHGGDGLRDATLDARAQRQLHPQTARTLLRSAVSERPACTNASSATRAKPSSASHRDIAKRLIDYGFHPYTVAFPLIVKAR